MRRSRDETVRADDFCSRIVAIAETPGSRARRIVSNQGDLIGAPDLLEPDGRIAAVVARFVPERLVLVEVFGREDVDWQRLDTCRHGTVARSVNRHVVVRDAGAGVVALALGADDVVGSLRIRRPAPRAGLRPGEFTAGAKADEQRPRAKSQPPALLP